MKHTEREFSLRSYFFPLTTLKAIHFIVILGIIVFFNTLFNNFVLDDIPQIVMNKNVHTLVNIPDFFINHSQGKEISNYYRPLPYVFYAYLYSLFQDNTFFFHLTQLFFHIGNSILIFLIFKKFLKQGIAFFLSLLFLVHPINQETVAYIANLQDVLFVFWGLLAFFIIQKKTYELKHIFFANIFLLLSLFSKESGILFIAVTLLYAIVFDKKKLIPHLIASFITCTIYILLRVTSQVPFQKEAGIPIMELSFWDRMLHVPAIIFTYVKTLFFPKELVALQSWIITEISFKTFYFPLVMDMLFFVAVFLLCFFIYKKKKEKNLMFFFLIWFIVGLILHLQIVPLDSTAGYRFFYFPFIGLLALLGLFINNLRIKKSVITISIFIGIVALSALSLRTMSRNTDWKDHSHLITHDAQIAKDDYIFEYLYGIELMQKNNNKEALLHTQRALELYPKSWLAWNSLGIIYAKEGNDKQAEKAYLESISLKKYTGAYENLALLYLEQEDEKKAKDFTRQATELFPTSDKLWYYRILAEYKDRDYESALYASKQYFNLRRDKKSYTIYNFLLQKHPLKIEGSKIQFEN